MFACIHKTFKNVDFSDFSVNVLSRENVLNLSVFDLFPSSYMFGDNNFRLFSKKKAEEILHGHEKGFV